MELFSPSSDPCELVELARSKDLSVEVRRALMKHPMLPMEGLMFLGRMEPRMFFEHPMVRLALVTDGHFLKKLPMNLKIRMVEMGVRVGPGTLRRLAGSQDDPVRLRKVVAKCPVLPEDLAKLYLRHCVAVRMALAGNSGLASSLVNRLGRDESPRVRAVVAKRPDIPEAVVRRLVVDGVDEVRWVLAKNKACPQFGLEGLLLDDCPAIRACASWALGLPRRDSALRAWMMKGKIPKKITAS